MVLGTDHIAEISIKITIGEDEITITEVVIGIIGPLIGITAGPEIETITGIVTGTIIHQIIEGKTTPKGMVIETRTTADPGIEIEIGGKGVAPEKAPNPEAVVDPKIDMRIGGRVEMMPETGRGVNQDVDPILM